MKITIIDNFLKFDGNSWKRPLGGSEAAVIYNSRELAKLGAEVHVFTKKPLENSLPVNIIDGVHYHWIENIFTDYKSYGGSDITIVNRRWEMLLYPELQELIKDSYKILWLHDTVSERDLIEDIYTGGFVDKIFVLTDFHLVNAANFVDDKRIVTSMFKMTRNGICPFDTADILKNKNPNMLVTASSLFKGTDMLIQYIWPLVKKEIPAAELHVLGGTYVPEDKPFYYNSDVLDQATPYFNMLRAKYHGRNGLYMPGAQSPEKVAEYMSRAGHVVLANVVRGAETFCIAALESFYYKAPMITCAHGALTETAPNTFSYLFDRPLAQDGKDMGDFAKFIIESMRNKEETQKKIQNFEPVREFIGWDSVAKEWLHFFNSVCGIKNPADLNESVRRSKDAINKHFNRQNTFLY